MQNQSIYFRSSTLPNTTNYSELVREICPHSSVSVGCVFDFRNKSDLFIRSLTTRCLGKFYVPVNLLLVLLSNSDSCILFLQMRCDSDFHEVLSVSLAFLISSYGEFSINSSVWRFKHIRIKLQYWCCILREYCLVLFPSLSAWN